MPSTNQVSVKVAFPRRTARKFNARFCWLYSPMKNWLLPPSAVPLTGICGLEGRVYPGFPGGRTRCWRITRRKPATLEQNLADTPRPRLTAELSWGIWLLPNMGTDTEFWPLNVARCPLSVIKRTSLPVYRSGTFNVQPSTLNFQRGVRKGACWAEYGDRHEVWAPGL